MKIKGIVEKTGNGKKKINSKNTFYEEKERQ